NHREMPWLIFSIQNDLLYFCPTVCVATHTHSHTYTHTCTHTHTHTHTLTHTNKHQHNYQHPAHKLGRRSPMKSANHRQVWKGSDAPTPSSGLSPSNRSGQREASSLL